MMIWSEAKRGTPSGDAAQLIQSIVLSIVNLVIFFEEFL